MEIVRENCTNEVKFKDLCFGEVFEFYDNSEKKILIKTHIRGTTYNAVRLCSGLAYAISDYATVTKLDAVLTIK